MKRFKSKKLKKKSLLLMVLFILIIVYGIKFLFNNINIKNDNIIKFIVNDINGYKSKITDIDVLLKYAFNINIDKKEEDSNNNEIVVKEEKIKEPIIYIYNTHQEEKYLSNYMNGYNISTGVLQASKMLKEYLHKYNIESIVEEDSISDKLHALNWKYGYSYRVSRMFLENTYKDNPSLKYFIDLHRDSSKYEETTTEIDGIKYARILFVVGLDNQNYEPNLELAMKLKEKIINYNEKLYRGIMKKSGKGVNGIYNQDFNSNCMLIEVGGQYNSIDEVDNTLKVFAKILKEYIEDDMYGKEKG